MPTLFPSSEPPSVGPESSVAMIIVALLFLVAVVAFYFYAT